MPGGYKFNHVETLKRAELYYRGKYESGQYDELGLYKYFFNIIKPTCDIATKFIDLDTKDYTFTPVSTGTELTLWAMQREFRIWLTQSNWAATLNRISEEYPKGHVILVPAGRGWDLVHPLNIRTDTSAEWLEKSDFVYRPMRLTRGEMKRSGWDIAKIEYYHRVHPNTNTFLVYDCLERDIHDWKRCIKVGLFDRHANGTYFHGTETYADNVAKDYLPAVELYSETTKKFPYREIKWEHVAGRWLGFGIPEYLFDNQIATNETENLERAALIFKSLQMWQSEDDELAGSNVLTGARNGDIINTKSPIQPLQKDNSDLSAYNNTRARWDNNTSEKTFSSDFTRGENFPSRTPAGVANIQASMVTSYFDLKRENLGIFLKRLAMEDTIPDFKRKTRKERTLTFSSTEEDLSLYNQAAIEYRLNPAIVKYAMKTGYYPSTLQREELKDRLTRELNEKKYRFLDMPADAYDNLEYKLDINITGEQADVTVKQGIYNLALQIYNANPGITRDPVGRTLLFKLLALSGENPAELGMLADQAKEAPPMAPGGSVAQPTQSAMPAGPAPITV